jgi:nitrile hydratase accessory protein
VSELQLDESGPAAPPRANGELVFDAPWQSRAFGVTAALADAGRLEWADFQAALIRRVGQADAAGEDTGTPDGYWRCWLDALGAVTAATGQVDDARWQQRSEEYAAREPGHDHDHSHDH